MSSIYLVTGGAGFIGSSIVRRLVARGDAVRLLDNFSSGRRENLSGLRDVEIIEADIRDELRLKWAFQGVSIVFHQAAIASVPRSVEDPVTANEVNLTGTLKVLQAARHAGARRVIYASSSSAYGDEPTFPKVESMLPSPLSPYAAAKVAGELYCHAFYRIYGLETVSLRYFNVFGPRQDPRSEYAAVIPRFVTAALRGEPAVIHGDGEQTRDFCFVEDVVTANLLAAGVDGKAAAGRVFNIASGQATSLIGVLHHLEGILGRAIGRQHEPPRVGDVRHSLADISAAGTTLGYRPAATFVDGLRRTVEALR